MRENAWRPSTNLHYWDAIISLGGSCQVAEQLNRWHLRAASYPFDWLFSTDAEYVIKALESRFEGFLAFENLTESPSPTRSRKLTDTRYHMIHQHIFPLNVPWQASYPEVKKTVDRRIKRLLDLRPSDTSPPGTRNDLLFIRTNLTLAQSQRLSALLTKQFGEGACLMTVNHTRKFQMRSAFFKEALGVYEIYDESEDKEGDRWQGYNPHWDRLLCSMRLREVSPFGDDSLFYDFYPCETDPVDRRPFRWTKKRSVLKLEAYGGYQCTMVWTSVFPVSVELTDANGTVIFAKKMDGNATEGFTFPITHQTRRVAIALSDTWRPSEQIHSPDQRELGVCLRSMKLRFSGS